MRVKIFLLIFFIVPLAGCRDLSSLPRVPDSQTPKPTPRLTPKPTVFPGPTLAPVATPEEETNSQGALPQPGSFQDALVTRVIDGDTIEIAGGIRVRYLGMDTPESSQSGKEEECFGYEAHKENQRLVGGKVVRLEEDFSETDGYGRLLRYVWVGETLINEILVNQGYARASSQRPDFKYQQRLLQAENKAKENQRGFWSACQYFGEPRKKCGCQKDYQ